MSEGIDICPGNYKIKRHECAVGNHHSIHSGHQRTRQVTRASADSLELLGSGLDSLCIAVIVARLEGQLGLDPFGTSEDVLFPTTFGELVSLYENIAR